MNSDSDTPERHRELAEFAELAELAELQRQHPRWECWLGVIPMYYARIPRSSPAIIVRAPTLEGLAEEMTKTEADLT